jgi:hypothetical protein
LARCDAGQRAARGSSSRSSPPDECEKEDYPLDCQCMRGRKPGDDEHPEGPRNNRDTTSNEENTEVA